MRKLSDNDFLTNLKIQCPLPIIPLLKERAKTFKEAREMLTGELSFFFTEPKLDKSKLIAKEPIESQGMTKSALESLLEPLKGLKNNVSAETVKEFIMPIADAEESKGKGGRGAVLWPLRYALSGQERSPDPFTLISIIGSEKSVSRILNAIAILGE